MIKMIKEEVKTSWKNFKVTKVYLMMNETKGSEQRVSLTRRSNIPLPWLLNVQLLNLKWEPKTNTRNSVSSVVRIFIIAAGGLRRSWYGLQESPRFSEIYRLRDSGLTRF